MGGCCSSENGPAYATLEDANAKAGELASLHDSDSETGEWSEPATLLTERDIKLLVEKQGFFFFFFFFFFFLLVFFLWRIGTGGRGEIIRSLLDAQGAITYDPGSHYSPLLTAVDLPRDLTLF